MCVCMQVAKLDRLNSRKREVRTSTQSSNQECLIVHVDRPGWGCLGFRPLIYFLTSSFEHLIIAVVIGIWMWVLRAVVPVT